MSSEALELMDNPRPGASDDEGAPESWETADLEERMKKLLPCMLSESDTVNKACFTDDTPRHDDSGDLQRERVDFVNLEPDHVDDFLREALRNPRDRVFILRLEQEVEKFMQDSRQLQLELQPMPSSYLRLAAHRVVQHYRLQSMVVDCNAPESTRIIARKMPESRFPAVRLADVPVHERQEKPDGSYTIKVEIKQRPRECTSSIANSNGTVEAGVKLNPPKSVEERKEEYIKARARIFSGTEFLSKSDDPETLTLGSSAIEVGRLKFEENYTSDDKPLNTVEKGDLAGRICNIKVEPDSIRVKMNSNKVAIFRDREKDRKDPDYDRSYDRYMQRFDPGFGICPGPFNMHAINPPVGNYNTEFPHLGSLPTGPQLHIDSPLPPPWGSQNIQCPWVGFNTLSYRSPDQMMGSFNSEHMGPPFGSIIYFHPPQSTCPGPSATYTHPGGHFQQSLIQPCLQPEANISQARRH